MLQRLISLFFVTACIILAGCSRLDALNVLSKPNALITRDVTYTPAANLALDIYSPVETRENQDSLYPVMLFFYGGGWTEGSKSDYRFVASTLVEKGYVVVVPDYRLYPTVTFPDFVEDGASATRWVIDNISRYGGDPDRVFLMGHSAGAHIAALLHFDERYLAKAGVLGPRPCAFIGLSGPYDFLPLVSLNLKNIFPENTRPASQPVNFVDGTEGAVLLVHGLNDKTVKPRNSAALAETVENAGGLAELKTYADTKHADTVAALAKPLTYLAPVADDVDRFAKQQACQNPN